jgi:hypothetical protein
MQTGDSEYSVRFSCHKCGQHLACEPCLQGTQIACPACKQSIWIVTDKIRACYRSLELAPGTPLPEVKQAHQERMKRWQPDRLPDDRQVQEQAREKARELEAAVAVITAYLAGQPPEVPAKPKAVPAEARPEPPAQPKQKEPKPAPAPAALHPALAARAKEAGSNRRWVLAGLGAALILALLAALVVGLFQKRGPSLTDESTGAHWVQATERARRAYCQAVLVELAQNGTLQRYRARVNADSFYEGLQAISRQQKPEDLNSRLLDLCSRLVADAASH